MPISVLHICWEALGHLSIDVSDSGCDALGDSSSRVLQHSGARCWVSSAFACLGCLRIHVSPYGFAMRRSVQWQCAIAILRSARSGTLPELVCERRSNIKQLNGNKSKSHFGRLRKHQNKHKIRLGFNASLNRLISLNYTRCRARANNLVAHRTLTARTAPLNRMH